MLLCVPCVVLHTAMLLTHTHTHNTPLVSISCSLKVYPKSSEEQLSAVTWAICQVAKVRNLYDGDLVGHLLDHRLTMHGLGWVFGPGL